MGHTLGVASPKMQIPIQFHGSESTQNRLNPAMERHMDVQDRDRPDKGIHGVVEQLALSGIADF